jgi:cbb3-type cytochrome oxidase subunit 3
MHQEAAGLKEIERRQPKYWSGDGLPQLATGIGWLLWGGLYLIGLSLLEGRSYLRYWATITLFLCLWGIAVPWALGRIKERMTYPRAGYALIPLKGSGVAAYTAGALLLGIHSLDVFGYRIIDVRGFGSFPVVVLIALAIAVQATRQWVRDALLWGFLLMLAMRLQPRAKTANDTAVYLTLVCMGGIGVVYGVLRLRRFLRENPKVAETEA